MIITPRIIDYRSAPSWWQNMIDELRKLPYLLTDEEWFELLNEMVAPYSGALKRHLRLDRTHHRYHYWLEFETEEAYTLFLLRWL